MVVLSQKKIKLLLHTCAGFTLRYAKCTSHQTVFSANKWHIDKTHNFYVMRVIIYH